MSIVDSILHLHPAARFMNDYLVITDPDTGADVIHYWNTDTLGARDDAALAAAGIAVAKSVKLAALSAACAAQILAGYSSSALGAPHIYPAKPTDQTNMLGSVTASLLPGLATGWTTPFWCQDASGTWSFVDHTAAQIQQAGADGKIGVATAQLKLAGLTATVEAASTADAIAAVTW